MDGSVGAAFGNYYTANASAGSLTGTFMGIGYGFSAIASALGSFNSSSATKAANKYQAEISANNVQIAQMQGSQAILRGETLESSERLKTAGLISTQRAAYAANGVDVTSGSAIEVQASTKFLGNVDAATIRDNALNEAWGYSVAATNASNAQQFYSASANNINPLESAVTGFLTSANSVAAKWYTSSRLGVPGYY